MSREKFLRAVAAIIGSGISTALGLAVILLIAASPTSGPINWPVALVSGFKLGAMVGFLACFMPHKYQTAKSYLACGVSFFIVMVALLALLAPSDVKIFNFSGFIGILLTSCFGAFISGTGYQGGAELAEALINKKQ